VSTPEIRPREDAICDLEFLTPAQLAPRQERLESWSQICFGSLGKILAS
jgi:hypothetical protein